MEVKEALYTYCLAYVKQRIASIKEELSHAQSSANEETKSSAGDKYETGRAMAQREVEMNTRQVMEAEKLLLKLESLSTIENIEGIIIPGSLVYTSGGVFYIAISIGLISLDQKQYYVVSSDSPIGKLLLGKTNGDSFIWNGHSNTINSIE